MIVQYCSKVRRWIPQLLTRLGAALGGWMMMENFITGFAGHEFQLRAELQEGLGAEKAEFFLDKVCLPTCACSDEQFLEYFFSDEDAALFAQLGLNCLRIPVSL